MKEQGYPFEERKSDCELSWCSIICILVICGGALTIAIIDANSDELIVEGIYTGRENVIDRNYGSCYIFVDHVPYLVNEEVYVQAAQIPINSTVQLWDMGGKSLIDRINIVEDN